MKLITLRKSFIIGITMILIAATVPHYAFAVIVQKGKLYFVGVGPAGPELASLQAINVIKEVDVVFTPKYIQGPFEEYLKGKDVRLAWPESGYFVVGKPYTYVDSQEKRKQLAESIMHHADTLSKQFKKEMSQGKSVALLVNGDPCLFSDLRWFRQYFSDSDFEVIPGMSSFNAGAALFKVDLVQPRGLNTVIIHSPIGGISEISALAKHKASMVFFMVGGLKPIVEELKKEYSAGTPIALAYFIGFPDKQKVIKGTLDTILKDTESEPETDMILVYLGNFLK
jgi:precorrin-4 methylase